MAKSVSQGSGFPMFVLIAGLMVFGVYFLQPHEHIIEEKGYSKEDISAFDSLLDAIKLEPQPEKMIDLFSDNR